jgi:tetratricopeptide (TPR) repeat protein
LISGCSTTRPGAAAPGNSWLSIFRPKPKFNEEPPIQVPDKLKDERDLTLKYATWMVERGQLQVARQKYQDLLEKNPNDVEAIIGLAQISEKNGQLSEAERGLRRAVELAPDAAHPQAALGQFLAGQKRWGESIDAYNRAVLADPCDRDTRYHLAVALVRNGDVEGALPHFIRTVGDAEAHYNAAVILKEEGRVEEARAQVEIAVAKKPALLEARQLLAEIRRPRRSRSGEQPDVLPAVHANASSERVSPVSGRIPVTMHVETAAGHSVSG